MGLRWADTGRLIVDTWLPAPRLMRGAFALLARALLTEFGDETCRGRCSRCLLQMSGMHAAIVSSGRRDEMGIKGWRARRFHVSRHDRSGRGFSDACRAGKRTPIGGDEQGSASGTGTRGIESDG